MRILSEHGNVVAVDFRPRAEIAIAITMQILYSDAHVVLARVGTLLDGKPFGTPQHVTVER